jgi:sortase B
MARNKSGNRNKKLIFLYAILGLCIGLAVFFAAAIFLELREIEQGQTFYAALPDEVRPRPAIPVRAVPDEALAEPPAAEEPEPWAPFVDFDAMREDFPNIIGWIQSAGTVINYPIVQGSDNDFYLYRFPDGTLHAWGSIYLDYRNAPDFSDHSMIIYGHDMRSGDMFGSLRYYRDQAFFEQHNSMFIFTPERDYLLVLFAGYVLDSYYEVPPMSFADEAGFEAFIADIRRRSIFTSGFEVEFGDRLVFLATCVAAGGINDRLIIVGALVEIDGP